VKRHAKAATAASNHRRNGQFSLGAIAAMLVCAAAFLGIGAPAASAAAEATPGYGYLSTFGQGEFSPFQIEPRSAIAIGVEGKIFVVDESVGVARIYGAGSKGAYPITSLTGGVLPVNLAVDPTDDTLYLEDYGAFNGEPKIVRLLSDGKAKPTYTADPGFELTPGEAIVVDPSTHDLLVATGGGESILRYDTGGNLVDTIATPGLTPQRLAMAEDGSIYVSGESTTITHLSSSGAVLDQIDVGDVPKSIAVDWTTGAIVAGFQGLLRSYAPTGELLSVITSPTDALNVGAAIDPETGRLYVFTGRAVDAYTPGLFPGVENFTVSDVDNHSAHISAEIDPGYVLGDHAAGLVFLEYSGDGGKTWTVTPKLGREMQGPGTQDFDLEDLLVNTEYLVRLRITNEHIVRITEPVSFSTPEVTPEVVTGIATEVGSTSAVLNGSVNPAGLATTYHFEWGPTSSYGSRLPLDDAPAGATRLVNIYRYRLTGLSPDTTYHYRIVAENSLGVSEGADQTFTTAAAAGGLPPRFFEQITPVDKKGNPLDPGIGFYAREDGDAFSYMNRGGESSSPNMAFAMSRRGPTDWESGIDLTDPINVTNTVPGALIGTTLIGISPDFSRIFLATNKALTPGASENGTNLYIKDLATGAYTLVVGSPDPYGVLNFIMVQQQNKLIASAPDLSWVVFWSPVPLADGTSGGDLYRWSESDGLEVVSHLPNGDPAYAEVVGDKELGTKSVSADGSRIYFTAPFSSEVGVFLREEGKPTKSISVSHVAGDPPTSHNARLLGISEDGRYAFFAIREEVKLTDDAPGNNGDVYRYDTDDESLEYVGGQASGSVNPVIDVSDDGDTAYWYGDAGIFVWRNGGAFHQIAPPTPAEASWPSMSDNGRYLAYQVGKKGTTSLYLYDAETDEGSCASCLPDGTPAAAYTVSLERFNSARFPQAVTEDGALFFTSAARLLATDTNGLKDVYMFQDGRLSLISPGNGAFEAIFGEVTPDGKDVFFSTAQKLVGRDNDESTDIYDARVGGGLSVQSPPPPQECLRDDCKATPSAGPELPFGGSEALSGPGNVTPPKRKHCGKGKRAKKVKGKVRCVKKHKANKAGKGGNR
jgi:hypothetical protein